MVLEHKVDNRVVVTKVIVLKVDNRVVVTKAIVLKVVVTKAIVQITDQGKLDQEAEMFLKQRSKKKSIKKQFKIKLRRRRRNYQDKVVVVRA